MARGAKILRRTGIGLLILLFTVASLVAAAFFALQTPWGRERVREQLNAALAPLFQGRLEIDRLGGMSLVGVSGVDATIFDASGKQVIRVQGMSAIASLPQLALEFIRNADGPQLEILSVRVDYADVTLREDEELGVTIASTFLPREEEPEDPAGGPGPSLYLRRIVFDRVWVHGSASGSPALDAELTAVAASLSHTPSAGLALELDRAELVTRALPLAVDPRGTVSGNIEVPADESLPLRLEGNLEGHAAQSPLSLSATWIGDHLHASVSLPRIPATFVNQLSEGLALEGDLTLVAEVEGELPELGFWVEADGTAAHVQLSGEAVVSSGMEVAAELAVARFDARRVAAGAPETDLRLAANVLLWEGDDTAFSGAYRVAIDQGNVAGQPTPQLWTRGTLQLGAASGFVSDGRLGADEAGVNASGSYRVSFPSQGPSRVELALAATLDEPARLARLGVRTAGEAKVSAQLAPDSGVLSAKASLSLRHVDVAPVQARAVEVALTASGTTDSPRIKGAATLNLLSGRAHADLDYSPTHQKLSLFAVDIDLVRLGLMLGTKMPIRTGTLGLDAQVERTPRSRHFVVDGRATATAGTIGQVTLVATGFELPETAPTIAALNDLRGSLSATGKLDLAELSPLLTEADLPIERTTGRVRFELSAKRVDDAPAGLELVAFVGTNGLRVVGERQSPAELGDPRASAVDMEPQSLEGIDIHLTARSRPGTGLAVATMILRDRRGTLLEAQAEAQIAKLWPHGLSDTAALARMPLRARLTVADRRLQSLPPLLRPPVLRGRLSLEAMLEGSVAQPRIDAFFSARGLRTPDHDARLDVEGKARITLNDGEFALSANTAGTKTAVADLRGQWRGDLRRAAEMSGDEPVVEGTADVKLTDFPLDVVPLLADRQVKGTLSGQVKLLDWGRDARLEADLRSNSLSVSRIPISAFSAKTRATGDQLLAEVALSTGSGALQASLDAGMRWGRRIVPELQKNGVAKLTARGFRLETLSPLVGTNVSEIGGELDAQTEIRVTPEQTQVAGQASLRRGVVQLPAIGQRFSNISARVSLADGRFKLEQLEAQGLTGKVSATGSARLDGFALRGADARITIKEREMLPITLEGAVLGDAWGNVTVAYESPEQGTQLLRVDVPEFHLITPETSGKGLQGLEEPADVRVGVRRADGVFVPLPVQPLEPGGGDDSAPASEPARPLRIDIKLGNNVTVERGRTAQAQLTGQLRIITAPEQEVTGRIEVRGGKLDVQGKRFEIERGVVTFDGRDPANPTITATARWDAPDYTIYADYVGDVEQGRIKLRSEPPLTQDEIASLLLFGSPDGSVGGGASGDQTALAVSVAGDTAAKGLNQVLDDFTNLDVSARIDTTTGSARPELVMRVSPRVTARVTRAVGAPAAGESPDRTFLTLELRLRRAWALSAVLGDRGASALDLIWRRRY